MITFHSTPVAAARVSARDVVVTAAPAAAAGSVSAPSDAELDEGWQETRYLLASPANAAILRAAADRSSDVTMSIDEVWASFGVPKE